MGEEDYEPALFCMYGCFFSSIVQYRYMSYVCINIFDVYRRLMRKVRDGEGNSTNVPKLTENKYS